MTTHIPALTLPQQLFAQPAVAILFPVVLGMGMGFLISPKSIQQGYMALKQPPFRPPPWLFAPVWTLLYGLMGYSAYRAWTIGMSSASPRTLALTLHGATLYTIQLGLNQLFSPLFWYYKKPVAACVDSVALTATIAYLISVWGQVDRMAGWLLAPYLAWMCFASYLSIAIGYLNGWNFEDKIRHEPPTAGSGRTKYVNEKAEGDKSK
ncbi:MAG: hypothetical protein M1826_000584 [Phylliscum demangeonii]|nr:MAG: hypothetical protein M1826_000584 [Phylliscum demangeonii]